MFGTTVYDHLASHPDDAALFGAAAAGFHADAIAHHGRARLSGVPHRRRRRRRQCLHDLDDDRATALLRTARDAAAAGGRPLVVETVVPSGAGPHDAKPAAARALRGAVLVDRGRRVVTPATAAEAQVRGSTLATLIDLDVGPAAG
jgi:hypothetical protein